MGVTRSDDDSLPALLEERGGEMEKLPQLVLLLMAPRAVAEESKGTPDAGFTNVVEADFVSTGCSPALLLSANRRVGTAGSFEVLSAIVRALFIL